MDKNNIIKETILELLKSMHFEGDIFIDDFDRDNTIVNIQNKSSWIFNWSSWC